MFFHGRLTGVSVYFPFRSCSHTAMYLCMIELQIMHASLIQMSVPPFACKFSPGKLMSMATVDAP